MKQKIGCLGTSMHSNMWEKSEKLVLVNQISSQTIQTNEQSQKIFPMLGIWKTWPGFLCIITFGRWAAGGITSSGTKLLLVVQNWQDIYMYYTSGVVYEPGSDVVHFRS